LDLDETHIRHRKPTNTAYDAQDTANLSNPSKTTISFLVSTAQAVLIHHGVTHFHPIGHSMGGLKALMLAYAE
jgi:pimeloyl-ACP methyl ester carboxylesterase